MKLTIYESTTKAPGQTDELFVFIDSASNKKMLMERRKYEY